MKTIYTKFLNMSVIWKFILAYFSISIIPVIFMSIYLYSTTSNAAISQAQMVMEQNISQTKASILQKVKVIENASQIISFNSNIQTFLINKYIDEASRLENYKYDITPFLDNILTQNKMMNSLRIYMGNPQVTELYDYFYSINRLSDEKWFPSFWSDKKTQSMWVSTHKARTYYNLPGRTNSEQVFSFCSKISTGYIEYSGILEIDVKEKIFLEILRDPLIKDIGQVFIVNEKGTIASQNISKYYNKPIKSLGITSLKYGIKKNYLQKVNGVESIVISLPITEINCNLVGIFPVTKINENVRQSITNMLLVMTASTMVLALIIYFITVTLLRRVRVLAKAMKQVREGNLDVSVPVNSKDEFGELTLSFNHMTSRIHDLVETVYKIRILEREAELKVLEAQINPHFLYNTLATIAWAARKAHSQEIVNIANSLAKFYRLVLSKGNTIISVKDELDMVRSYLDIQKIRFQDTFDVYYEIDESVYKLNIIKNMLQPLVENALSHGIEPKRKHGTIIIKANLTEKSLIFNIIDDGIGMKPKDLEKIMLGKYDNPKGSGYALNNIRERLKALYGHEQNFSIFSKPGIGTEITIEINCVVFL